MEARRSKGRSGVAPENIPALGRVLRSWHRRGVELHDVDVRTRALAEQLVSLEAALGSFASDGLQSVDDAWSQRAGPMFSGIEDRLAQLERNLAQIQQATMRSGEYTSLMAAELQSLRRTESYAVAYRETPLATVRIGVFQPGDLLFDRALHTVRQQTYPRWEAIVVTDGPDPLVAERIAALGDSRIRCVQRPRQGPYPSDPLTRWRVAGTHPFNESISHAKGSWIAPIDHDDEWDPDHLEVLINAALRTRAELVYGQCRAEVAGVGQTLFGRWPPIEGDFGFQGTVYHAGIAEFMLYDVTSHLTGEVADWNLARRMLDAGVRFEFVERPVTTYHVAATSLHFEGWRTRVAEQDQAS
jgi:hypothetical protein